MARKNREIVGRTEFVDLPDQQLYGVPAKVDSGAYSSSVWASEIVEKNGKLTFVLFDKRSPFYTGEVITAPSFTSARVRNSFGQVERRYKVPMALRLRGRSVRATVALANRSANRYPILLGRRTLNGRFLIDVSRTPTQPSARVLIIANKIQPSVRAFFVTSDHAVQYVFATYNDLIFSLGRRTRITLADTAEDVANFDAIYFKSRNKDAFAAAAVAAYAADNDVPFFDQVVAQFPAISKLQQYVHLSLHHIAVPESIFMYHSRLVKSYALVAKHLGVPFILKDIAGSKGRSNYLVHNEQEFQRACDAAERNDIRLIAQRFIANDGDYRVVVLGNAIGLVMHRQRTGDTHLNNVSAGGKATLVDVGALPTGVRRRSLMAAAAMELAVAGVDMVQDKDSGKWYCLEVNENPQVASGAFVAEHQAAFERFINRVLTKKGR